MWLFVINNPTDDDRDAVLTIDCVAIVCALERGEKGTPHFQGAVYFKNQRALTGVKKLLKRAHLDACNGSWQDQIDYCLKGEQPKEEWEELGTNGPNYGLNVNVIRHEGTVEQGRRNDILRLKQMIDEGKSMLDVADANFGAFLKYNRGLEKYRLLKRKRARDPIEVRWYYGPAGSGKTYAAFEEFPDAFLVETPEKGQRLWFDGYDGENTLVFDDYRDGSVAYHKLLRICNTTGPAAKMETKGGTVSLDNVTTIIFTSILPPDKELAVCDEQFMRRCPASKWRKFPCRV